MRRAAVDQADEAPKDLENPDLPPDVQTERREAKQQVDAQK